WSVTGGTAGNVSFVDDTDPATDATFSVSGVYELTLTASDGLLSDTDTVTITVNEENISPTNQAPVANAGTNQTITLPTDTVTLAGSATDDGLPSNTLTYVWSVTGGTAGNVSFVDDTDPATDATFSAAGTYTLTLTASDSVLSDTDTVMITVEEEIIVPTGDVDLALSPVSDTVTDGDIFEVTLQALSSGQQYDLAEAYLDFDPTVLQVLSVTPVTTALPVAIVGPTFDNTLGTIGYGAGVFSNFPSGDNDVLTIEFQAVGVGTSNITFFDPEGVPSTIVTFDGNDILGTTTGATITVEEAVSNIAPVADAGENQSVEDTDENGTEDVTLDGSASSDADGTIVSYEWSFGVEGTASGATPTVTLPLGETVITLTVTDDEGVTDTDTVTVNVQQPAQGTDVFLAVSGPQNTLTVGDTFDVVVQVQSNTVPVDTAEIHLDFDTAFLQVSSITQGTSLGVVLENTSDNSTGEIDYAAGTFSNTPPSGQFNLVTVTLQATAAGQTQIDLATDVFPRDTQVLSAGDEVLDSVLGLPLSLTIQEAQSNVPPTADAGTNQTVTDEDNTGAEDVTLDGSGSSDVDGTIVSYQWLIDDQEVATGVNPTISLLVGTTVVELVVTDDEGATDSDTVSVTVNGPIQIDDVFVVTLPETTEVAVGQSFDLTVEVQAGQQAVDAAEVHIDFDPAFLQVTNVVGGTMLELPIQNTSDNNNGTVDYVAGTFQQPFPTGTFDLVTITFTALQATETTGVNIAPLVFPRQTQVTFNGNDILTQATGASVTISENATLAGSVDLQGRPIAPNAQWSVPLTVNLYEPGTTNLVYAFNTTTDNSGNFTVEGIAPGEYDVAVKNPKTLQVVENLTLVTGNNDYDFGLLLAGDANNDNLITLQDFSIVTGSFNQAQGDPDYDDRADFNENNFVNLQDFSLLSANFNTAGEEPGSTPASAPLAAPVNAPLPEGVVAAEMPVMQTLDEAQANVLNDETTGIADLTFSPLQQTADEGDTGIFVDVVLEAGTTEVDAVELYIQFDPTVLEVVGLSTNSMFPIPLVLPSFDNTEGTIAFGAGTLFNTSVSGTQTVITIEFDTVGAGVSPLEFYDPEDVPSTNITSAGGDATGTMFTGEITVVGPNTAPIAVADSYSVDEDTTLNVDALTGVLANDTDAEGDSLTAVLETEPSNGLLVLNADGSFDYTPNADFNGTDSFTYKANDGQEDSPVVTVTITVNDVAEPNTAPVAVADSYTTSEDIALIVDAATGVLANDSDPEGDSLTVSVLNDVTSGTLSLNADGSFTYTPNADFNGSDRFTYEVTDGEFTVSASASININPVNDAPVAENDMYTIDEDGVATGNVLDNDTDAEGDSLTALIASSASFGSVEFNSDGSFTYTPNPDFNGSDSFSYSVSDG
ncbi:MAG: Ig-like domain-containing protein, partial [Chloroflexota bacterium]